MAMNLLRSGSAGVRIALANPSSARLLPVAPRNLGKVPMTSPFLVLQTRPNFCTGAPAGHRSKQTSSFSDMSKGTQSSTFWSTHLEQKLYHLSSYSLLLLPVSMVVNPAHVLDYVVALGLPLHMTIGMKSVYLDYVNPTIRPVVVYGTHLLAVAMAVALIKFNMTDVGIAEAVKQIFKH